MRRWLFLPRFNPTSQLFLIRSKQTTNFPAFWFAIYSMRTRAFYFNKLIVKFINIFLLFMIDTNSARGIYPVLNFPKLRCCWTRSFPHRAFYILHSHPLYILDMQFLINKLSITTYNLQVVTVALTYIIVVFLK